MLSLFLHLSTLRSETFAARKFRGLVQPLSRVNYFQIFRGHKFPRSLCFDKIHEYKVSCVTGNGSKKNNILMYLRPFFEFLVFVLIRTKVLGHKISQIGLFQKFRWKHFREKAFLKTFAEKTLEKKTQKRETAKLSPNESF